ncbi:hypothetical protein BKA70DRAFT_360221 [Coprinopsis sp. MPI-PUGE-AT-0042]|nr:hypothetical protein BKA70DRAFT_360221 [Coprinopsis sp. MPI-PUGE-AT-0042]
MTLSTKQVAIIFGSVGLLTLAGLSIFLWYLWRRRNGERGSDSYAGSVSSRATLTKSRPANHDDSATQSLLERTRTNDSEAQRRALHEEIESFLPEPQGPVLMHNMRELQGMMLELDRLTAGQTFGTPAETKQRIDELRYQLSKVLPLEMQSTLFDATRSPISSPFRPNQPLP